MSRTTLVTFAFLTFSLFPISYWTARAEETGEKPNASTYAELLLRLAELDAEIKVKDASRGVSSIDLGRTEITDDDLAVLAALAKHQKPGVLEHLEFDRTEVGDKGMKYLESISGLTSMDIEFTKITDQGLSHIRHLTSLEQLDLEGTKITRESLKHLRRLKNLRELDVRGTKITEQEAKSLKKYLPHADIKAGLYPRDDASAEPQSEDVSLGGSRPLEGSPITLDVQDTPLSEVLEEIRRQTGNALRVGGVGSPKVLSQPVSFSVKNAPFWEVMSLLEQEAGARLDEFDDGVLWLSRAGGTLDRYDLVESPVVKGAFRLQPARRSPFDDWFYVLLATEPKYGWPAFESYSFEVETEPGERFGYEWDARSMRPRRYDVHTGRLTALLELDELKPLESEASDDSATSKPQSFPDDLTRVAKLQFRAPLRVPTRWDRIALPSLGDIGPKPMSFDGGSVRVEDVVLTKQGDTAILQLVIRVDKLPVAPKESILIDDNGTTHAAYVAEPVRLSGEQDHKFFRLGFEVKPIEGSWSKADLVLHNESRSRKWELANVSEEVDVAVQNAGEVKVWVRGAGLDEDGDLSIDLHTTGFRLPIERARLAFGDQKVSPNAWSGTDQDYNLQFPADALPDDPLAARLSLYVPTASERIVLEHRWKDVQVRGEDR